MAEQNGSKRALPVRKRIVFAAILTVALMAGGAWYMTGVGKQSTEDAFVDGRMYPISSRVPGYVTEVLVQDNQRVRAGEVLVRLDPTDYEVALAQARAELASAQAQLAAGQLNVPLEISQTSSRVSSLRAQIAGTNRQLAELAKAREAARQALLEAQAVLDKAKLDSMRYESLLASQVVSQSSLDDARTSVVTNQARVAAAQARLEAVDDQEATLRESRKRLEAEMELAGTGRDVADIRAREAEARAAQVTLAEAKLRQAELNLAYVQIKSPADGYVTRKAVEPGRMISAGQSLLTIVPLGQGDIWVTANFKETQLTHMQPGQRAWISVDTYPGAKIPCRVESIMAGTGSVFSLFPPENATGNYVKVVQRVPVKLAIDFAMAGELPQLRMGMSVIATILTKAE
ncbi:HlyD family secretion protein [Desulfocurvibacter africanus]|uniref:HlyD family secretion protein n=1 Tax=Desulfocurvibacter africanus TaxID=873 RepID=UPI000428A845|nr:HlyD family secretion protein [Desulfocurvibacter africanus]